MSHVFSSRYFSIIKADKLQREDSVCVSTSLCLVLGIHFLFTIRIISFPTPEIHNRAAEAGDMLTVKLSRECFIYFLHYVLCLIEKSFPTHQRKIDSVSSSSRKPHFKQTR